jgi:hypothetical protein
MRLHLDLNVNAIRLLEGKPVALLPLLWSALLAQHLGLGMAEAGLVRRLPCDQLLPKPGAAGVGGRLGATAAVNRHRNCTAASDDSKVVHLQRVPHADSIAPGSMPQRGLRWL